MPKTENKYETGCHGRRRRRSRSISSRHRSAEPHSNNYEKNAQVKCRSQILITKDKHKKCGNLGRTFEVNRKDILEHQALCQATQLALEKILSAEECLSGIHSDCTPEELKAEIALAKGQAITVFVNRDGLPTLTIVLPQPFPTVANLKKAIALTASLQLKRESQELRRIGIESTATTVKKNKPQETSDEDSSDVDNDHQRQRRRRRRHRHNQTKSSNSSSSSSAHRGELVCSSARSGGTHRPDVSWRFLWRAYALCNVETPNAPLNDSDGRQLLSDCGIGNNSILKFVKRENHFGRRRQRR